MNPPPRTLHSIRIGTPGAPAVVFGHGWGRSHRDFIPVAEALAPVADCHLIDLPGFGASIRPEASWGSAEYADYLALYLPDALGLTRFAWVGHSFGGRIGLRLAVAAPQLLRQLVIVAGAGVPRRLTAREQMKRRYNGWRFRRLRDRARSEEERIALEKRFGSADYVASRESGMRDIFTATISENQSDALPRITAPTVLIYGSNDTETPPETGRAMAALIPGASYVECPGYDHISILDRGRHQIALAAKEGLNAQPAGGKLSQQGQAA